jgi:hypothetical protein
MVRPAWSIRSRKCSPFASRPEGRAQVVGDGVDVVLQLGVLARQAVLRLAPLGHVAQVGDGTGQAAVRQAEQARRDRHAHRAPVPAPHVEVLVADRVLGTQGRGDALEVVAPVHEQGEGPIHDLVGPVAEHLLHRRVRVGDEAARIDDHHRVGAGLQEGARRRERVLDVAVPLLLADAHDRHDRARARVVSQPRSRHRRAYDLTIAPEDLDGHVGETPGLLEHVGELAARGAVGEQRRPALAAEALAAAAALAEAIAHPVDAALGVDQQDRIVETGERLDQRERRSGVEALALFAAGLRLQVKLPCS